MAPQVSYSTSTNISEKYILKVNDGIKASAKRWNVTLPTDVDFSQHRHFRKSTPRLGNRPIADSTKINYEGQYRQFWRFCAIKGDYDSMLLLLPKPPAFSPAMNVETVEEFVKFKRKTKGETTLDNRESPILDVFDCQITNEGSWKAPKNVDIFRAAIHDLHHANNHNMGYEEACDECMKLQGERRHHGCHHHSGNPLLKRKGDKVGTRREGRWLRGKRKLTTPSQ